MDIFIAMERLFETYRHIGIWQGTQGMDKSMGVSHDSPRTSMLVVSEFIGCSPSFSGAIRVNPWDVDAVAEAVNLALKMSEAEKRLSDEVLSVLKSLCEDPINTVFIFSGRGWECLSDWLTPCENLGIAAEHGYFISKKEWESCYSSGDVEWKTMVKPVMRSCMDATDGSTIVFKESALFWHHQDADPDFGTCQAKELLDHLESVLANELVVVKRGQHIVVVKPQGFSSSPLRYSSLPKLKVMKRDYFLLLGIITLLLLSGFVASTSPAKIVSGFISNHGTSLMKWLWSLKTTSKTAVSTKSMVKFENGYSVETVLDGSKLGIEPYSLEVLPNGELLILDSENSNVYKISSSLSLYSRPRLVTGSPEGYPGHVDGRLRDAKLNNPKGLTVDDRGNIYVADTVNNAIRKISEAGVTTIAGGKMVRGGGGHVDGPSEDAKFSNDFDVVYVGSSCSLLVVDRGNRAIREIQLHFDDCAYQYGSGFPLGIAVLIAAGFFGYMLALLQRRLGSILSYQTDQEICKDVHDQKPLKPVRPSLIPTGDEQEQQEESFLVPLRVFMSNARLFLAELFSGMFPGLKKKQAVSFSFDHQETNLSAYTTAPWPVQESFVIHNKDEPPPPIESRNLTPQKTYPFMSKDAESIQQLRQSRALFRSLDPEFQQEQQQQQQKHKKHQHHRRHHSTIPHTHYQQISEKTNEIVFGPVQEQDQRRLAAAAATAKSMEYGDQMNLHYRAHQSVSYPYGYYYT
ncbi:Uncharacterized protein HA466_0085360 [Hirschfeldia incana]|nr:Uncharacterized protein HA466_0085360 [Hirschfeldia incana]